MARTRTFETYLNLSVGGSDEHEFALRIGYEFTPAFPGSRDEPGHDASAEVVSVRLTRPDGTYGLLVPNWLSDLIEADADLLSSLVEDACEQDASDKADAEERRAEADRDDRLMGVR